MDFIPLTQKGAPNGVATLDSGGKVPSAQLPPQQNPVFSVCTTASSTTEKSVNIENFTRDTNSIVVVRVTLSNTAPTPTLNVSNTGAAQIRYNGNAIIGRSLVAGDHVFQFDGEYWNWLNYPAASSDAIPVGVYRTYGTPLNSAFTNWLPADGRIVPQNEYPELFDAIGENVGGNVVSYDLYAEDSEVAGIAYSPTLNLFVALAFTSSWYMFSSTDARTWVRGSGFGQVAAIAGVSKYSNRGGVTWSAELNAFFMVTHTAQDAVSVYKSTDGTSWTLVGTPFTAAGGTTAIMGIKYFGGTINRLFVYGGRKTSTAGSFYNAYIWSSADGGVTWTTSAALRTGVSTSEPWVTDIGFQTVSNTLVAMISNLEKRSVSATNIGILSSTNGTTWTSRLTDVSFTSVAWSGTTFIAVGYSMPQAGATPLAVYASTTGTSWAETGAKPSTSYSQRYSSVVWDSVGLRFITTVYYGGTEGIRIYASSNGALWSVIGNFPRVKERYETPSLLFVANLKMLVILMAEPGYQGTSRPTTLIVSEEGSHIRDFNAMMPYTYMRVRT